MGCDGGRKADRRFLVDPFELQAHRVSIGVSIGITLTADDQNIDGLLKHADAAMYGAKQRGGSGFQFHSIAGAQH
ncbi:MAG: diguanylate cyclase [Nitrospiraceae bacterium]